MTLVHANPVLKLHTTCNTLPFTLSALQNSRHVLQGFGEVFPVSQHPECSIDSGGNSFLECYLQCCQLQGCGVLFTLLTFCAYAT